MAVALGGNFLAAVDQFGVVLTCGQNDAGQLGLQTPPYVDPITLQRPLLGAIEFNFDSDAHNAVMVSAGRRHAAFVTRSGSVYTWGKGEHGELGNGVEEGHLLPQLTPQLAYSTLIHRSPATMIACGTKYTLLLTASGHVWGCGKNQYFQIGVQNMDDPLQVSNRDIRVFTRMPPERFDCGDGDTKIAFIAAGVNRSAAVGRSNGLLWTWGKGLGGGLGHGYGTYRCYAPVPIHLPRDTFGEDVVSASLSNYTTMAVTRSGALWVAGCSSEGQLGLGNVYKCLAFERVGTADDFGNGGVRNVVCSKEHSLIVSYDGSVRVCGSADSGCFDPEIDIDCCVPTLIDPAFFNNEPVVLVSANKTRSVAVTRSGRLFTWGFETPNEFEGLAHAHTQPYEWLPRRVLRMNIPNTLIPRLRLWPYTLTGDQMLTFAMVQHPRLGAGSSFGTAPDNMLHSIWDSVMIPGASHFGIGLRNVLGML